MALTRKEITKRYRERNLEKIKERRRKHYLENKDELNKKRREYYLENKERENKSSKRWYQKNKEYRKKYTKKYREKNRKLFQDYKDLERFGGRKEEIFLRDNYLCRLCGASESLNKKPLIIHHIDLSGKLEIINNNPENLITLCNRCHHHTHRYQEKNKITFLSIEDIVRTMARVIEEYRNIYPFPRNRKVTNA